LVGWIFIKKYVLLVVMALAFVLASCGGASESEKGKKETSEVDVAEAATKSSINLKEIRKSDTGTPIYQSDVDITNIGKGYNVRYGHFDRNRLDTMHAVETCSANIVKAKVVKCTGQVEQASSGPLYKGDCPALGGTKWELEIQRIYKGKLKEKQHIQIMQE